MNDMAIGRNAPCPCGSGKKYKKCCLHKDEDARREAARAAVEAFEPLEDRPRQATAEPWEAFEEKDPHLQTMDEQWDAFEAAGYEDQMALFVQSLDEAEGLDNEMAFEMLNTIYSEAVMRDERDRFDGLIRTLGEKRPDLYDDNAHFYLGGLLHFVNPQHYKVAATFELVPAWLRFLESRRLLEAERRKAALNEVSELYSSLSELFETYRDDSALYKDVRRAWQGTVE